MKLYLVFTTADDRFDAYSRAVVAADSEDEARRIHPDGESLVKVDEDALGTWVPFKYVQAEYLGEARAGMKPGVILASYIGR
jgi:hypothetical protein